MSTSAFVPPVLWRPSEARIAGSQLKRFEAWLCENKGLSFKNYEELWEWSVKDIEVFWEAFWQFAPMKAHTPYGRILNAKKMPGARWFEGATLNYAEHMLARASDPVSHKRPALIYRSERVTRGEISWSALEQQVASMAQTLRSLGVTKGDRVVSYMPNIPHTVIALNAVASLGAIWSSCSPDMGTVSVADRFTQIEPKVIFAVDGYFYGGKGFDRRDTLLEILQALPSVKAVVLIDNLTAGATLNVTGLNRLVKVVDWNASMAKEKNAKPHYLPVEFNTPLWIVYSSGTTGMPKPIVHSHGGATIESYKGTGIHLDVGPQDRFYWFSSTGWIMWNLLVSTLSTGATVLLFDGNPGYPDLDASFEFASREKATFFGTSPAFVAQCIKGGLNPSIKFDLSSIRSVGSTGSPLSEECHEWIYRGIGKDIALCSISGGTDPGAAFLCSAPTLPIYSGEMQCRCLATDVDSFDDAGNSLRGQVGELVCKQPIPSMPLYFWGDDDGSRYFNSYFDLYPGVWRHGDWLQLNERKESVTSKIYGRSDSTINRYGIRMGTSELYRVVEEFDEIADSLVVDLEYLGKPSFLALFVVLRDTSIVSTSAVPRGPANSGSETASGQTGVPAGLGERILNAIRVKLSARHVPNIAYAIPEVPRTMTGKKLEVPVKRILLGHPLEKAVNRDSMANPHSIDWIIDFSSAFTYGKG
jgi:acetoacetyl-CoA synthetase